MKEDSWELKQPTQKVVEYLDGLTIDGKNIEFVSDVQAKPISENYVEVKITFIASDYKLLKNSYLKRENRILKVPNRHRFKKVIQGYEDLRIYGIPYFIEHHMTATKIFSSVVASLIVNILFLVLMYSH